MQERALAATAGTGDRDRFGRCDLKRDAAERLNVAVGIVFHEPLGAENRHSCAGAGWSLIAKRSVGSRAAARAAG